MAVATVVGILEEGRLIGFELDGDNVVCGDARMVGNTIVAYGLRLRGAIDHKLKESGELASFCLANEEG